jgi:hypothetical protein
MAVAVAFGLVADWAQGVSHSDAAFGLPLPFVVMALLGHSVWKALVDQDRRIAKIEAELYGRNSADSGKNGANEGES